MAIKELDDLLNLVSGDDRAAFEAILERNAAAQTALQGRETVYQAFVTGQEPTLPTPTRTADPDPVRQTSTRPTPAALDLAMLDAELAKRTPTLLKSFTESPEFTSIIESRAKAIADAQLKASTGDLIGRAMHGADEIYRIRRSHEREFGDDLDSAAFEKYVVDNPGKYASLSDAHNAFVMEKRIEARINKGVTEKLAAQQTNEVPGSSLPTSQTPLGAMIRDNAKRTNAPDAQRGAGLDAASRAFRELQSSHLN